MAEIKECIAIIDEGKKFDEIQGTCCMSTIASIFFF